MQHITPILLVLLGGCVIASAESQPMKLLAPPNNGDTYVIAHRGAHRGIPENTLAAYAKAIDLGCDFVEIDLRTTKDGAFVSIHSGAIDAYVEGATGNIADFTLEELRAFDIGARHGERWTGTQIPTFEEILDLCKDTIGIYLDLKSGSIPEIARMIQSRKMERQVVWYLTPKKVADLRIVCPDCLEMPDPGTERNLARVLETYHPRVIAPVWRAFSPTYAPKCHAEGALVFVDEKDETSWRDALAWGADGIQTDDPEGLIAWLHARKK